MPAPLPSALGASGLPDWEDQLNIRPISMEEAFARQNDRIAYLRSIGSPWAEAVYELRDLLVGLEDREFWDGIPEDEREKIQNLPLEKREIENLKFSPEGWLTHKVRAFPARGPGGTVVPVYRPTSENLSQELRIVRRLANRRGITWRTKRVSRLPSALRGHLAPGATPEEPL